MADTVLTELKIHEFDTLEQMSQHESEIGANDIVFTPDMSAKLFLFKHAWADYLVSDMSWLRADTFSWHSGDVYKTAYDHLANDSGNLYAWASGAAIYYTLTETPAVGDNVYSSNVNDDPSQIESVDNGTITFDDPRSGVQKVATRDATGDSTPFVLGIGLKTDTIGGTTITYYLAQDGHKICLPDQESNIVALYESTGVAWYYILDTVNKQFKLPRTKYGFTGLRDSVGGYVEPALPNITGKAWARGPEVKFNGAEGALYVTSTADAYGSGHSEGGATAQFNLDASRSSTIYKDGATVQPPATQMYLYFYVGNFEQSAIEQTAGITAETLNGKADRDLGNIPTNYDYVVESQMPTAENGYTWYRKYKSGWVEQGGKVEIAVPTTTITLPVEMADTNYTVLATAYSYSSTSEFHPSIVNIRRDDSLSTTSFKLMAKNHNAQSYVTTAFWQVSGMSGQ